VERRIRGGVSPETSKSSTRAILSPWLQIAAETQPSARQATPDDPDA
jgi:hypothetical protein